MESHANAFATRLCTKIIDRDASSQFLPQMHARLCLLYQRGLSVHTHVGSHHSHHHLLQVEDHQPFLQKGIYFIPYKTPGNTPPPPPFWSSSNTRQTRPPRTSSTRQLQKTQTICPTRKKHTAWHHQQRRPSGHGKTPWSGATLTASLLGDPRRAAL